MKIKTSLLVYFLRSLFPVNAAAMTVSVCFILLYPNFFLWNNAWAAIFILAHCIAITIVLGRVRSRSFAFIYTRGFSRDVLWGHKMLASVISAACVWGPGALLIGLGGRSALQDLFQNPYFPIMAEREMRAVWFWLFGYGILLPLFHYVWIRKAQPTKSSGNGMLLAVGTVAAAFILMTFRYHAYWFAGVCWVVGSVVILTCIVFGRLLHRSLEVQK